MSEEIERLHEAIVKVETTMSEIRGSRLGDIQPEHLARYLRLHAKFNDHVLLALRRIEGAIASSRPSGTD